MTIESFASAIATAPGTIGSATLLDGRIVIVVGPSPIEVYSPAGSLLASIDPYQGGAGIIPNAGGDVAALADGGFVVTGRQNTEIAFRIYNADLTERTSQPGIVATPGFFNGGDNFSHVIKALPGGGFVIEWITNEGALPAGQLGVTSGGTPIFESGSAPQGTSVDVRGSIYDANGTLTSPARFLVTQGVVQFPTYSVESRFGQQYLNDIDVLPSGQIVTTIFGQRWSPPTGGDSNGTFSTGYYYDTFRINNGLNGAAVLGETPYNTTAFNFQNVANNYYGPSQTVVLNSGLIAGIFTVDSGVIGANRAEVKLQLMNVSGTPEGAAVNLGLPFSSTSLQPQLKALATDSGGFILAYVAPASDATASDASTYNIYAREYSNAGALVSTQQITTAAGYEQIYDLVRGPDGTYMITSGVVGAANAFTNLFVGADDLVINGTSAAETLNATGVNKTWIYSGGGADIINGGAGVNYLYGSTGDSVFNGGSGVNVMRGGSGNEFMRSGPQADTLDGGAGFDTVSWLSENSGLTLNLNNQAFNAGTAAGDTISNFEAYYLTGFADTFTNNNSGGQVYGFGGNDLLIGGAGNDGLYTGDGNDTAFGGDGLDTIYLGDGDDYAQADGGASSILSGDAGNDTLYGGSGDDYMVGGEGNDVMVGLGGINSMYGGSGNDLMIAGDGAGSVVDGGAGANTLYGGSGNDYIVGGELADVMVGGAGSDYLFGNAGNDAIYAGAGTDYIFGNAGNDFIYTDDIGFADRDYLYAGGGTGVDTIVDFTAGDGANADVLVVALGNGVSNFAQAQAAMTQAGIYTVLTLAGGDQVYLYNVTTTQMTANNFIFI